MLIGNVMIKMTIIYKGWHDMLYYFSLYRWIHTIWVSKWILGTCHSIRIYYFICCRISPCAVFCPHQQHSGDKTGCNKGKSKYVFNTLRWYQMLVGIKPMADNKTNIPLYLFKLVDSHSTPSIRKESWRYWHLVWYFTDAYLVSSCNKCKMASI